MTCPSGEVLLTRRFRPDGDSWSGVTSYLWSDTGTLLDSYVGARLHKEYTCVDCDVGCFVSEFNFDDAAKAISNTLSYWIETPAESINTNFQGGLDAEFFYYCIESCELVRQPTSAPTISALPTHAPTDSPTTQPTGIPSREPTGVCVSSVQQRSRRDPSPH